MSMRSLLLRVLLSLTLVLNGVTATAAATSMHAARATEIASTTMPAHAMPCHGHADVRTASMHAHPALTNAASAKCGHPTPDCCKNGACRCDCTLFAQASFPDASVSSLVLGHNRGVARLPMSHDEPSLPHLIRPPIG